MADALLSDADVGLAPAAAPVAAPAAAPTPVTAAPSAPPADGSADPHPLTIHSGAPALMSDADVGLAPGDSAAASAQGIGPLGNTQDDGWLSGAAKGAATGVIKGLSHIPGQVGDVHDLARFLAAGAASMFDSRSASDIYASMKAKDAAYDRANPLSTGNLPNAGDIAAPILAKTGEYKPTSELGSLAQSGVEAAAGGLGPGAGAALEGAGARAIIGSTIKQAPLNAVAGVAGQGATDATGNPYLGLAASLAAPGAAEAAGHGIAKVAAPFAEDLPVVGKAFTGTRDARVGQQLLHTADDPAALKASVGLGDGVAPAQTALPGSTPTLGQASGDLGILRAEERARTANNVPFVDREVDQNSARQTALRNAAPTDADTMLPSQFLTQRAADIDAAGEAAQGRILQHAQDLAAQLGPGNAPEANGQAIRTAQEAAKEQARQMRAGLYGAVDPDGSLSLVATPAADAAKAVAGNIDPLGAPVGGDAARIMAKMQNLPAVVPYKSMIALDQDITAAMSAERRAKGETPDWARLSQLKSGTMSAINDAVDNQHGYEQSAVQTGQMKPDDTIFSRLQDEWNAPGDAATRRQAGAARTPDDGLSGAGSSDASGSTGAGGTAAGASRQGPGDPGLSSQDGSGPRQVGVGPAPQAPLFDPEAMTRAPARPDVPRPQSLHDFIRQAGGMDDPGGDLAAMGLQKLIAKPGQGSSPDRMREAAAEAGYLGGDTAHAVHNTDINDLLNAAENGERHYSVRDYDAVHAWDEHDQAKMDWRRQQADSDGRSSVAGMRSKPPLSSYGVDDIYPPGTAPPPTPANGPLTPNFDEGAQARLSAAKSAHADYAQTFKQGPVGSDLKTNGFAGQYQTGAGALAGKILPSGPGGYDVMRARLKANAGNEVGLAAIQDQAVSPLRAGLLPDGTLNPKALDAWKGKFGPALRALDEVNPGFSGKFDTAAGATDILTRAGAVRKAQMDAVQGSAAAKLMGKTTPGEVGATLLGMLSDPKKGPTQIKQVREALAANPDALAGAQKAAVDAIAQKFVNTAESGTSGEKSIASAGLQKFVAANQASLRGLLPKHSVDTLQAVAADLERANRDVTGTRIKGTSQTAKNQHGALASAAGGHVGHTALGVALVEGLSQAYEHGGLHGAALAAAPLGAALALNKLRASGLSKEQSMFRDALLNPDRARAYMSRVTPGEPGTPYKIVANSLRRELIAAPVVKQAYGQ